MCVFIGVRMLDQSLGRIWKYWIPPRIVSSLSRVMLWKIRPETELGAFGLSSEFRVIATTGFHKLIGLVIDFSNDSYETNFQKAERWVKFVI